MKEPAKPNFPGTGDDDLLLIELVLAGDRRAFEPLVRRHERRVYRVTLAILGNVEDAEEAMQDAFVKAFHHLGQFRREARFTTWLTRIAVNEALQKRQGRKDFISLDDTRDAPEQAAEPFTPRRLEPWRADPERLYGKRELRRIIEAAIQSLPAIYRQAFVLRDVEEMSSEEAAEAIGITTGALKSRLLRARLMMRETLAASLALPPTLRKKIINAAQDLGMAVAIRMRKADGK
ncbi:MAG TPA: sigma-70 family RNA polymerase sigma factor [Candidatus Dormibacteraeota bacterium]|nr:sigma-70 family RNA polymerase sigma factor [Candidatus Dormibacteraeota bacterium]